MDSQSTARIQAVIKEQEDTQDVYEKALARVASLNVLNADELTEITQALRERASALRVWKEKEYKQFDVGQHVGLLLEKVQTAETHRGARINDGNALLDDAKAASRVADAIGWRRFWQKDARRAHKEALEQYKLLIDQATTLIDQSKLLSEARDSEMRELSEAQKLFETAIQEARQAFLHFQEVATRFDAIAVPFFEACQRIVDGAGDVPAPE